MPFITLIKALTNKGEDKPEATAPGFDGLDLKKNDELFGQDLTRKPNLGMNSLSLGARNAKRGSMGGFGGMGGGY